MLGINTWISYWPPLSTSFSSRTSVLIPPSQTFHYGIRPLDQGLPRTTMPHVINYYSLIGDQLKQPIVFYHQLTQPIGDHFTHFVIRVLCGALPVICVLGGILSSILPSFLTKQGSRLTGMRADCLML
uniref:Uncharacterized protein n=1 Tax=Picea glauca TaxID=3330 RepID=A0A101LZU8_PICGL|nr:hypothetical protein ABT39_MTgene4434 [Picea glauca]QHR88829.1 hypothetical protein Q903MT_gene2848 [Picea sitchensis]